MKRKAQGAIEYLFMLAAALVIILIVIRMLQKRGNTANQVANQAESNISNTLMSQITGTTTSSTS